MVHMCSLECFFWGGRGFSGIEAWFTRNANADANANARNEDMKMNEDVCTCILTCESCKTQTQAACICISRVSQGYSVLKTLTNEENGRENVENVAMK